MEWSGSSPKTGRSPCLLCPCQTCINTLTFGSMIYRNRSLSTKAIVESSQEESHFVSLSTTALPKHGNWNSDLFSLFHFYLICVWICVNMLCICEVTFVFPRLFNSHYLSWSVCGFVFSTLFQELYRDHVFILVQLFTSPGPPLLLPSDCRCWAAHSLITHLCATEIPCSVTTSKVSIGNSFCCLSNSDKFYGNCGPLDTVYKGTATWPLLLCEILLFL